MKNSFAVVSSQFQQDQDFLGDFIQAIKNGCKEKKKSREAQGLSNDNFCKENVLFSAGPSLMNGQIIGGNIVDQ